MAASSMAMRCEKGCLRTPRPSHSSRSKATKCAASSAVSRSPVDGKLDAQVRQRLCAVGHGGDWLAAPIEGGQLLAVIDHQAALAVDLFGHAPARRLEAALQ